MDIVVFVLFVSSTVPGLIAREFIWYTPTFDRWLVVSTATCISWYSYQQDINWSFHFILVFLKISPT